MKLLIVEDELLLAKQLKDMVKALEPNCEIVGHTISIESTVNWLQQHTAPEMILMDIELADGQCFEIFNQIPVLSPVIFTTAYDEYALRAFKVNSVDYLLKPIQATELRNAINKWKLTNENRGDAVALSRIDALIDEIRSVASPAAYRNRFLVKQGQKMLSVSTSDIAHFYARNTVNFLVTRTGQKFIIDYTLDELERLVEPKRFFRANRQYIIAHDIIAAIHPWFNGKVKVESKLPADDDIVISRDKAPLFKEWLGG